MPVGHQTHLFKTREPINALGYYLELIIPINNLLVEKHGQHHFTSFFWEIGQE